MICQPCKDTRHGECKGCDCQHRLLERSPLDDVPNPLTPPEWASE